MISTDSKDNSRITKQDFKDFLPFIGTAIIFFGAIKQIFFYRLFGIDITTYLEFSEYLTLFLNDLILLGAFLVGIFLLGYLFNDYQNNKLRNFTNISTKPSKQLPPKFIQRMFIYIKSSSPGHFSFIFSIGLYGMSYFYHDSLIMFAHIALINTFIQYLMLIIMRETSFVYRSEGKKSPKWIFYFFVFSMTMIFILFLTALKFLTITDGAGDVAKIKLADRSIVTGYNLNYIGKTRNFIFIENKLISSYIIIPYDEITQLEIRAKRKSE